MPTVVNLTKATQTNNLSVIWNGLNNIFLEDSSSSGSLITGFAATSSSEKKNNIPTTETILLESNTKVDDSQTILKVNLEAVAKANVQPLSGTTPTAELLVKIISKDGRTNDVIVGSINLSNKFRTYTRVWNLNLRAHGFNQGFKIGVWVQAASQFTTAIDFLDINLEVEEPPNVATLNGLQLNTFIGDLDTKLSISGSLTGQEMTILQGDLEAKLGVATLLSPQTTTINQGDLATIAPDTWMIWDGSNPTIYPIDLFVGNNAIAAEEVIFGDLTDWLSWGSALPYFTAWGITIGNTASAVEFTGWETWNPTTSGYSTIDILIPNEGTFDDGQLSANPWFVTYLSADTGSIYPINIVTNDVALWDDAGISEWSSWEASAEQFIDFAFSVGTTGFYTAGDGPWDFWGYNMPNLYTPIPFDYPTVATHTDPYESPKVIREGSIDFTGVPVSADNINPWMKWDDRPEHIDLTFQFIVDATRVDPEPPSNLQSWYSYDLTGVLTPPGADNPWMEWDEHPRRISIIVDSSAGPTIHDDAYQSSNVENWYTFRYIDVPVSADNPGPWMLYFNQPRWVGLNIVSSGANTPFDNAHTSPNVQSWYDYDLEGLVLTSGQSPWMIWDEHPRYKEFEIVAEGSALSDDEFMSSAVTSFYGIRYSDVYASADNPNPWMKYYNQPRYTETIVTNTSVVTLVETSSESTTISFFYDIDYTTISAANPWEVWDNQPQPLPISFNADIGATLDDAFQSTNTQSFYDLSYPITVSASAIWMAWDEHPRYRSFAINIDASAAVFEDTRTSAAGDVWMDLDFEQELVPNSAVSQLNVFFSPIGVATGSDYVNPNVINQCNLDYVHPSSAANPWMLWDNHPCYMKIYSRLDEFALLEIPGSGADSVWFDYDGSNDSPQFIVSDSTVSGGFDLTTNGDKFAYVAYTTDTNNVNSFVINVSAFDLELTTELTLTSAGEQPYLIKLTQLEKVFVGYLNDAGSGYEPRYNFLTFNPVNKTLAKSPNRVGDPEVPGPGSFTGIQLLDGTVLEYRFISGSASFHHYILDQDTETFISDASGFAETSALLNFATVGPDNAAFNYDHDIGTARLAHVSAPSIESNFVGIAGIYPDSFAAHDTNTYIQVYKNRNDLDILQYKKFNFIPGTNPVLVSQGVISTSADFQEPNSMKTLEIQEDVFFTAAQASGNVYGIFYSFDASGLLVGRSSDWFLVASSASNSEPIQISKLGSLDRVALLYKHENEKLVIKILQP